MKNNRKNLFVFQIAILLFYIITPAITSFATEASNNIESSKQLYKLIEPVEVEGEIIVEQGNYFYGTPVDETIFIQYKNYEIAINQTVAEYVTETNVDVEYKEYSSDQFNTKELIETELYNSLNGGSIKVLSNTDYPVLDEENAILFGNVVYIPLSNQQPVEQEVVDELQDDKQNADNQVLVEEENEIKDTIIDEEKIDSVQNAKVNEILDSKEAKKAVLNIEKVDESRQFTKSDRYLIAEVDVPIYDNRSGKLVVVGTIKKGQIVARKEASTLWHKIQFSDFEAFVKKENTRPYEGDAPTDENDGSYKITREKITALENITVYERSSGNLIELGIISKGQKYAIVNDYGGKWIYVLFGNRVGFIESSKVASDFKPSDKYFKTIIDQVPVYDNRSGKLEIVGYLPIDQEYPRYEASPAWHFIQFDDFKGYVKKDHTIPSDGSTITDENYGKVKYEPRKFRANSNVTVYSRTNSGLVPIATILPGQTYSVVLDYGGDWLYVSIADRTGFVRTSDVLKDFIDSDKYFKVIEDQVPVYDNRSGRLEIVGYLNKDEEYRRYEASPKWHYIQFSDFKGYVEKQYTIPSSGKTIKNLNDKYKKTNLYGTVLEDIQVYDNSSGKLVPFGTIKKGQIYNIALDYGGKWVYVLLGDRVGFVDSAYLEIGLKIIVPELYMYETYDNLINYSKQKRIATLYYGDVVTVLEQRGYAAKVQTTNGKVGWIHKDKFDQIDNHSWYVKTDKNIRLEPTTASSVIGLLKAGSIVKVLEYVFLENATYKEWFKIETIDKIIGWVWAGGSNGFNMTPFEREYYDGVTNRISLYTPLNSKSTITAEEIDRFIASKVGKDSYMYGMGEAYIQAQEESGLNAIYLVAHSALETGYGTSSIVKTKYNYYGIGAFDACPKECSSSFEGKRTGIIEGAKWIARNYVYRDQYKQFTIFNMRYNNNVHQYATDDAWDVKIVNIANEMSDFLGY